MRRRDFVELPAAVAAGTLTSSAASAAPKKPLAAKLGTQHGTTDPILKACAAFGVHNICSGLPSRQLDEKWTVDSLTRLRERVESFGIKLEMVPVPLSSLPIDRVEMPQHPAGTLARTRPRNRRHLPDAPQRLPRRHPRRQVQHEHSRRCAQRVHNGPRRGQVLNLQLRQAPRSP